MASLGIPLKQHYASIFGDLSGVYRSKWFVSKESEWWGSYFQVREVLGGQADAMLKLAFQLQRKCTLALPIWFPPKKPARDCCRFFFRFFQAGLLASIAFAHISSARRGVPSNESCEQPG